jgi:hypothetical protein
MGYLGKIRYNFPYSSSKFSEQLGMLLRQFLIRYQIKLTHLVVNYKKNSILKPAS